MHELKILNKNLGTLRNVAKQKNILMTKNPYLRLFKIGGQTYVAYLINNKKIYQDFYVAINYS